MLFKNFFCVVLAMAMGLAISAHGWAAQPLPRGGLTITNDDGEKSLYTLLYPLLKKYGLPATAFVVTSYVGTSGHVTWPQLRIMHFWGVKAENHTANHLNLPTLTSALALSQITGARNKLALEGFLSLNAFAAPFGEFTTRELTLMKQAGITINRRAWSEGDGFNYPATFDPMGVEVVSVKSGPNGLTANDVKVLIDQAVQGKKWLVLVTHGFVSGTIPADEYEYDISQFEQVLQYAAYWKNLGQLDVCTLTKAAETLLYYKKLP